MAQGQQQVISGHRGPENKGAPAVERKTATPSLPPGAKVYKARGARYVYQIASPEPTYDPATGRRERPKSTRVSFAPNGRAVVTNPEHQRILEADTASFGFGNDYWLETDEQVRATEDAAKILIGQLRNVNVGTLSGALRAEVIKSLGLEVKDFVPPAPPADGGSSAKA